MALEKNVDVLFIMKDLQKHDIMNVKINWNLRGYDLLCFLTSNRVY